MEEKIIKVTNGEILYMYEGNEYRVVSYTILNKNRRPIKRVSFCKGRDFSFFGDRFDLSKEELEKRKKIEIIINNKNAMYSPLKNLLEEEKIFLIQDDYTNTPEERSMKIIDNGEKIRIVFRNNKVYDMRHMSKFPVVIIGTTYNERSRIDQTENGEQIKSKLEKLFEDFEKELENQYMNQARRQLEGEER